MKVFLRINWIWLSLLLKKTSPKNSYLKKINKSSYNKEHILRKFKTIYMIKNLWLKFLKWLRYCKCECHFLGYHINDGRGCSFCDDWHTKKKRKIKPVIPAGFLIVGGVYLIGTPLRMSFLQLSQRISIYSTL